MKKISFIGHTTDRGGASHVMTILANSLAERGFEVDLVFFRIINPYETSDKVNLISLCDKDSEVGFKEAFTKLNNYMKTSGSNLNISFSLATSCMAVLCSKLNKIPIIASERNDPKKAESKIMFTASKLFYAMADFVVFQTKQVTEYYSKKVQKKSKIILNPVEVPIKKVPSDKKLIVSVGKLLPQKNHKLLIDAFYDFDKIHPGYTVQIFGDGAGRGDIEAHISSLGLEDKVVLMGKHDNIPDKIKEASMFVMPSNYEGLSNALMEAMCMGIPSISTMVAGAEDIIDNGKSGLIVPVGDKDALVKAMCKYAEEPSLAEKFSNEALKFADRCKFDAITSEWEELANKFC